MTLLGREHYDIIEQFDKEFSHKRLDKEAKEFWSKGHVYQNGEVNDLFLAFRRGYSFGKAVNSQ